MNKVRILTIASIGLLLINVALIAFFSLNKPKHIELDKPRKVIIEKLYFDAEQVAAYDALISVHKSEMERLQKGLLEHKKNLYLSLQTNAEKINSDSLLQLIAHDQLEVELLNYGHFNNIKHLCKAKQLNAFNELSAELALLFSPRPKPHDKP